MVTIFALPNLILLLTVAFVLAWFVRTLRLAYTRSGIEVGLAVRHQRLVIALLALWLVYTGIGSALQLFYHPTGLPPRMLLVVAPMVAALVWLMYNRTVARLVHTLPLHTTILIQGFRLGAELAIYTAVQRGWMSAEMSFEGSRPDRNWDILPPLLALPVALYIRQHPGTTTARQLAWGFNIIGLIILLNVVLHGLLSIPSPIQQLYYTPATILPTQFPFIWLPAILVFFGLAMHILSIRRLRSV